MNEKVGLSAKVITPVVMTLVVSYIANGGLTGNDMIIYDVSDLPRL